MSAPTDALRCPRCGATLAASNPAPSVQWVACPHCAASIAVAPHRGVPPRYTWEVYRGLYPPQPLLRRPFLSYRRLVPPLLVAIAVLAAVLMVLAAFDTWQGSQPGSFTVNGSVITVSGAPIVHATVVLIDESGTVRTVTNLSGGFEFASVPTGGLNLTASASGYQPVRVLSYVSSGYDAGSVGLEVVLAAGSGANLSTEALSPYTDLENFTAYLGATAVISGLAAIVIGWSAMIVRRTDRPAFAVAGGVAGIGLPFAYFLTLAGFAFPMLFFIGGIVGGLGGLAAAVGWIELIQIPERSSPPAPPG
ncbi:MAG: carboxypeptidase-like regulatory domain-containing protein [Thermoplasmata archaeon]